MSQSPTQQSATLAGMLLEPGGFERVRLAWRLARDQRVAPVIKLAIPTIVALYVLSPIDLLPDFLLGIGQLDDLGVIVLALALTVRLLPKLAPDEIVAEHLTTIRGNREPAAAFEPAGEPSRPIIDVDYRVRGAPRSD